MNGRGRQPTALALSARPMSILVKLTKSEKGLVHLLNFLAQHNARLLEERPDLPLLYESGVRYEREYPEAWLDYLAMLEQGHEDCDGLAAARAGELLARGWRAMSPEDGGYALAMRLQPESIPAWVVLRTRGQHGAKAGMYHCVVLYRVGETWWRDDPSARLGMFPDGDRHPYQGQQATPLPRTASPAAVAGSPFALNPAAFLPPRLRGSPPALPTRAVPFWAPLTP